MECGTALVKPKMRDDIAVELTEIATADQEWLATAPTMDTWKWAGRDRERLEQVARARGYKRGWVYYRHAGAAGPANRRVNYAILRQYYINRHDNKRYTMSEIVKFTKSDGPLTKRICLDEKGAVKSDGSACVMSRGVARRTPMTCVGTLGALIGGLRSDQAIALGSLRHGLPREVEVATKTKAIGADHLALRRQHHISSPARFRAARLRYQGNAGGRCRAAPPRGRVLAGALSVIPELGGVGRLRGRRPAPASTIRSTGAPVPGSNGVHVYLCGARCRRQRALPEGAS